MRDRRTNGHLYTPEVTEANINFIKQICFLLFWGGGKKQSVKNTIRGDNYMIYITFMLALKMIGANVSK